MRIAAIAFAAVLGLAASSASAMAGCNWNSAKSSEVVASATQTTPPPAQSTPVKLPESDKAS